MSRPALCSYHALVLSQLRRRHPHLTRDDRRRMAADLARQCCTTRRDG